MDLKQRKENTLMLEKIEVRRRRGWQRMRWLDGIIDTMDVSLSITFLALSPRICSNSCPLSWWCHPTISFSVALFSSWPQSFPASGSFPVSQLFASCGQSTGALASAAVLPVNIQGWFPLGLTGLNSLLTNGLSRVFSSITIWKLQFFSGQLSLWTNSHIHTWLLGKPSLG